MTDAPTTYPALAARLLALPPSVGAVRLIAVDGPSGSGKSTFAPRLAAALAQALRLSQDEPFESGKRTKDSERAATDERTATDERAWISGRAVAEGGAESYGRATLSGGAAESRGSEPFGGSVPLVRSDDFRVPWNADPLTWWPPFEQDVLAPLAAGFPGHLRRYDWHRDEYGPSEQVPPAVALVVEGVGAAWRGSPATYRIWVDAPPALRRARALQRDGLAYADAWDEWAELEAHHFASDRTQDRVDLFVDGMAVSGPTFHATKTP